MSINRTSPLARLVFYAFISLPLLRAAPLRNGPIQIFEANPMSPSKPTLWIYLAVAIGLVLLGGAFAGLTIALMGQDEIYLQVIKTSGEPAEMKHAGRVLRLLKRGKHWVLVTLLLGNVITNETLPIVLDRSLGGGWPAVLGSTVLIVIFGEIIPQSICVRYGLPIGAYLSPLVLVLMYILSPVAWPTAKLLDKLLGEDHGTTYKKAGLKTLVTLHKSLGAAGEQLNSDEVTIISAVLDLKAKPIGSIMTPIKDVFTMSSDTVLDEKTMDIILGAGYSRIPIYEPKNPQNYVGMLLVKILITYDPEDCKKVNEFALATLPETAPETSCLDIVNFFQEGKSHMVLVSERPGQDSGAIGVVTLEDVIEELIGEEIIDESDVYIDVHKAIRRTNQAPKSKIDKHGVIAEPETDIARGEEDLIDLRDEDKPQHKALQRAVTGELAANGSAADKAKPNPNLRRTSSIASVTKDGQPKPLSNVDQFRHLGPSNLASRPRQTRYNTVKIKPGGGSLAENVIKANGAKNDGSPLAVSIASPAPHGGAGTGLLSSAGKDASDGVLAVQQGYGTIGGTSPKHPDGGGQTGLSAAAQANPSTTIPEEEPHRQRSKASTKEHSDSESTIGSLKRKDVSPRHMKERGTARSGSITEQIVDLGGVRKVVLETTSSSEENALSGGNGDEVSNRKENGEGPSEGGVPVDGRDDDQEDGEEDGKKGKGEGGGRKKRRRRKRKPAGEGKGGDADEGAPLLGR
ncbi:cell agglutination protein Mam3 [Xanthoria parietina]